MENNALVLHDPNVSLGLQKVADGLFKSGMFPNAKNAFGAYAIVQYGHELGIPPMMALKNINIISGQLACNAQLMLSMAMSRGVTYRVINETDKGATIEFKRGDITYTATFNEDDAKAAGLAGKDNWKKYARDMYFWRAAAKGIRRIAPDAVLGLYTKDEISNGEIVDVSPKVYSVAAVPATDIIVAATESTPAEVTPVEDHNPDDIVIVKIEGVTSKTGKTAAGREWTAHFIKTATGTTYGTFDKNIADKAHEHWTSGELVAIKWKPGKKEGTREIVELELAA
ncbi:MAG: hypothetical protein WC373_14485 [Smithella sp.]|jgi:hypothetical protein